MYWDSDWALREYDEDHWNLWNELSETAGLWTQTFRDYWGLDASEAPKHLQPDEWKEFRRYAEAVAPRLLTAATTLSLTPTVSSEGPPAATFTKAQRSWIREILRDVAKIRPVRDRITLDVADDATRQLQGATDRAARLLALVSARSLSERGSVFVRRATKLHIWGFEPECAIIMAMRC